MPLAVDSLTVIHVLLFWQNYEISHANVTLDAFKARYATELANHKAEMAEGHRRIQTLQSALEAAHQDARKIKDTYDTEVMRLQGENFDLQSALVALKTEMAGQKQQLSPSLGDFMKWIHESSVGANILLDSSASSGDIHHVLAHNALVKVRLENWREAYEDAKQVILHILMCVCTQLLTRQVYHRSDIRHGLYCQGTCTNRKRRTRGRDAGAGLRVQELQSN